jgi:hypothetical protein
MNSVYYLIALILLVTFMSVVRDHHVESFENNGGITKLQKAKSLAYFKQLRSFFMSQASVISDEDKIKAMFFSPTFLDIFCDMNPKASEDIRCKNIFADNISITDQSLSQDCNLLNTSIAGSKENATVRILNGMYYLSKTCFNMSIKSIEPFDDGFRMDLDKTKNYNKLVLLRPTMISLHLYGTFEIVYNNNTDNIFTNYSSDNTNATKCIYVRPLTNEMTDIVTTPNTQTSTRRSLPLTSNQLADTMCTLYFLNFVKDVVGRSNEMFYNNLSLTFDKSFLMSQTNKFENPFVITMPLTSPLSVNHFLAKHIKISFNPRDNNVFTVDIGANKTNSLPFKCVIHPEFAKKIRSFAIDELLKQHYQFHIAMTYTMDRVILTAFFRNVAYPGSDFFVMQHFEVSSGNPVYMQFKEIDLVNVGNKINYKNNVVHIFSNPNFALLANSLGYTL